MVQCVRGNHSESFFVAVIPANVAVVFSTASHMTTAYSGDATIWWIATNAVKSYKLMAPPCLRDSLRTIPGCCPLRPYERTLSAKKIDSKKSSIRAIYAWTSDVSTTHCWDAEWSSETVPCILSQVPIRRSVESSFF